MPDATPQENFEAALQHHQAGRLNDAETLYREILTAQPDHPGATHFLGVVACQMGQHDVAVEWIRKAIILQPNNPAAYSHLGAALAGEGQVHEALAAYQRALELKPDHADATYNLGNLLRDRGRLDDAVAAYRRALRLKPDGAEICNNLGIALGLKGETDEAIRAYQQAVQIKPGHAEAHINLGEALTDSGRVDEAVVALGRAIELRPDYPEAHYNLGMALRKSGRLDEAVAAFRRALAIRPKYAEAQTNLGNTLLEQGLLDEAIAAYRQAFLLRPDMPAFQSNIILALHYHPSQDVARSSREQELWNERFSASLAGSVRAHGNERSPERRLRVGYVSADFREHVVGLNLLPLFRNHDHQNFEILCYSGVVKPDAVTEVFRAGSDRWRNSAGLTDATLAEIIRQDDVDVLVDLSQHTAGNRLPVFARKPAPVQVSFAGYPESAGVGAIEYRISDGELESELGVGRSEFGSAPLSPLSPREAPLSDLRSSISDFRPAERVFLIESFWCYDPCGVELAVNGLPAEENGLVTFGSLSKFSKINDVVLRLWARVLAEVRNSRLVLCSDAGSHGRRALEVLAEQGIEEDRVEFLAPRPRKEYLELYQRVDIALDPFPYGGHTTSLDALWMGVPVVSLAGKRAVSRAGLSILSNLGLPELVAFSEEDYVKIAADLAGDLPRLAELRRTLRARMEGSVLMDAARFARNIEDTYRAMWRERCAQKSS